MNVLVVVATNLEITSQNILQKPILITGVGMVNTAINLTKILMKEKYDLVINMGIAGSFVSEFKNGFVVEVTEDNFSEIGFENEFVFSKFKEFDLKTKYKVDPKTSLKKAKAITVNTVNGKTSTISKIMSIEGPQIESMEGAAVFKVCEEFNVSCIQVRSISNQVESRDKTKWDLDLAITNLNIEVEKIINNL